MITDINQKLADLLMYLAESEFKEDVTSIVLSIGGQETPENSAAATVHHKRSQRKKSIEKQTFTFERC